jgi:hypothetical protein
MTTVLASSGTINLGSLISSTSCTLNLAGNTLNIGSLVNTLSSSLNLDANNLSVGNYGVTPAVAPTFGTIASGVLTGTYYYGVTYYTAVGETNVTTTNSVVLSSNDVVVNIPTSGTGVTGRNIYRSKNGGSAGVLFLLTTIPDNTTTSYLDNTPDISLGASPPTSNTTSPTLVTLLSSNSVTLRGPTSINITGTDPTTIGSATSATHIYSLTTSGTSTIGNGTTDTTNIGATGGSVVNVYAPIVTGGQKFVNSTTSYVPTSISYYEEQTSVSISFTGSFTANFTFVIIRIGNIVICRFPNLQAVATSSNVLIGTGMPTRFCPVAGEAVSIAVPQKDNGVAIATYGYWSIISTGQITCARDTTQTNYTNGNICGPYASSLVWTTV